MISCHNKHVIRLFDSYCSGPSNQAHLCPKQSPSSPESVTCIYKVSLSSQKQLLITLTWTKKLIGQGFTIDVTNSYSPSKRNANSQQMRMTKGAETFESCNFKVHVLWDLSAARYDRGPEPARGFYVMVLVDSELGLRIGDKDGVSLNMKDLKAGMPNFSVVSRRELFSGTAVCSTKAKFSETGITHDILIRCEAEDALTVGIDKKTIFAVKRLKWNFRGNQAVFIDGLVVDMMWDVHGWLFNPTSSSAVFMFRTRCGLNSRLWLEEKLWESEREHEGIGFSFFVCAHKSSH